MNQKTDDLSYLLNVARGAIHAHCAGHPIPSCPIVHPPQPVFVSLFTQSDHRLRGCIGNLRSQETSLAQEVQKSAIAAATRDPRMEPVTMEELPSLTIEISILGEEEPVTSTNALNPHRWGITVRADRRVGVLLPMVTGVETVEQQIQIALSKAQIATHEPYQIWRFGVQKLCE